MNTRQRTILVIAALLVIVVAAIAFVIGRSAGTNDAGPEPSTSTSSTATDAPSTTAPEPEPTTPQDVSIAAIEGLLKGENTDVCKFFTEDADVLDVRQDEADVPTPMSQWCPDGEAYGHYEDVKNFAIVAETEAPEAAKVGLEFVSGPIRARVGVSLVNVDSQWLIDRWCFYKGDYPDGLDSVLTCVDGDDA